MAPQGATHAELEVSFRKDWVSDYVARIFTSGKHWRGESGHYRVLRIDAKAESPPLGHTVQAIGLTVQNCLSAGVGMAVVAALIRDLVRRNTDRLVLVASQEVIEQLGTDGGGYFNANSSHPRRSEGASKPW